ncbi:MAG TPA: hypothetical protein DEO84_00130 [candidate division Zixibacteria bacterium]|jgi:hypothetical protein|nr:hypothetical protein [candidate division Zixibacteria bacterium]HBY99703.1 hypothetical protein [candidate division Zixibacteria bacterium]
MRHIIKSILISMLLLSNIGLGQLMVVDYAKYVSPRHLAPVPSYRMYLYLDTAQGMCRFAPAIRQPSIQYPGDYFYPPDSYIFPQFIPTDIIVKMSPSEIEVANKFLSEDIYPILSDSIVISSLKEYSYDCPNAYHIEPYTMLSDADTVYVVSGWLGKFLSFYRVVPGDKRLTIPDLMNQLEKLTPLSKQIEIKKFRTESDSSNYLLEYVDKDKMFRIRNYLIKATLPPDSSDAPESYHNLIEVTKFYDKEAIP